MDKGILTRWNRENGGLRELVQIAVPMSTMSRENRVTKENTEKALRVMKKGQKIGKVAG